MQGQDWAEGVTEIVLSFWNTDGQGVGLNRVESKIKEFFQVLFWNYNKNCIPLLLAAFSFKHTILLLLHSLMFLCV